MKFQDIIEPFETVQVSTSPVSTATSVEAMGELAAVGQKMAKSRNAEIVGAGSRDADGALMYMFEMKGPVRRTRCAPGRPHASRRCARAATHPTDFGHVSQEYHEMLGLTINKGKLFRLSAVASNKRWPKREELYRNIMYSFVPKGY